MLDIKYIKEHVGIVKKAIKDKNEICDIGRILRLDKERRRIIKKRDRLRKERKYYQRKIRDMLLQLTPELRKKALKNVRNKLKNE